LQKPAASAAERGWFLVYAPASFLYRQIVTFSIAIFVAWQDLAIGLAIAAWSILAGLVFPAAKALWRVVPLPRPTWNRRRAVAVTICGIIAASVLLFVIPLPLHTTTEGVVWLPDNAVVREGVDGFVHRPLAEPGQAVSAGTALVRSEDAILDTAVSVLRARVDELDARYNAERIIDQVQAQITATELRQARADLDHESRRAERLVAYSGTDGVFAVMAPEDLPGRFVREGETIGYVLPSGSRIVRAAVSQDDIDLVRNHLRQITVKLSERVDETLSATVLREVPGGGEDLPASALGTSGGGSVAIDPRDRRGTKALRRVFQLDLKLDDRSSTSANFGQRVFIRFEHDWEPLGWQLWRRLRQLLLSSLSI
jgi:putative peptide zinc metalloprotease protein